MIDIEKNKAKFIEIVNSIERNFDKNALIDKLNNSDFFEAPASTKYHMSVKGGLCQHCLNVYSNLLDLVKSKGLENTISLDSIKIVSLFHDFSKMNLYKEGYKNVKVYCESGSKEDGLGKFDWVSKKQYEIIDDDNRFIYGSHEDTAEFMTRCFIPLTLDESIAIKNHHGTFSYDYASKKMVGLVFEKYTLAFLLFIADSISAFIDEIGGNSSE